MHIKKLTKKIWRAGRSPRFPTSVEVMRFVYLTSGIGCGKENKLDKDSVIRCIHCGHRIFYKKRERKMI